MNESSKATRGKMNTCQILKHCTIWGEMVLGEQRYKQSFIGKLFGKVALKRVLKDDVPLAGCTPTVSSMKVTGNGVVEIQKRVRITLLNEYEYFVEYDFIQEIHASIIPGYRFHRAPRRGYELLQTGSRPGL